MTSLPRSVSVMLQASAMPSRNGRAPRRLITAAHAGDLHIRQFDNQLAVSLVLWMGRRIWGGWPRAPGLLRRTYTRTDIRAFPKAAGRPIRLMRPFYVAPTFRVLLMVSWRRFSPGPEHIRRSVGRGAGVRSRSGSACGR